MLPIDIQEATFKRQHSIPNIQKIAFNNYNRWNSLICRWNSWICHCTSRIWLVFQMMLKCCLSTFNRQHSRGNIHEATFKRQHSTIIIVGIHDFFIGIHEFVTRIQEFVIFYMEFMNSNEKFIYSNDYNCWMLPFECCLMNVASWMLTIECR